MKRKQVSISALADLADMPRPNLSAWLNGRADINVETLDRVIAGMGKRVVLANPGKTRGL